MKGSEFLAAMSDKPATAWMATALDCAKTGSICPWSWREVPVADDKGNTGVVYAQTDVFAIGEDTDDVFRLPLFPEIAQSIANLFGWSLPTPKMARAVFAAADVKLVPRPMSPNLYANLNQFSDHNEIISGLIHDANADTASLVSGQGKDIVIAKSMPPGKVLIYGWFDASGTCPEATQTSPEGMKYIQPLSSVHGSDYTDYSQLPRFFRGDMTVNGEPALLADVLQNPALAGLVSTEGALPQIRYVSSVAPAAVDLNAPKEGTYRKGVRREVMMALNGWRSS